MFLRLLVLCILSLPVHGQRLERFSGKDESGVNRGFQQIRNYFDYMDATVPDTLIDGQKGELIYFLLSDTVWAPAFRFVQPVPPMSMPDKGDYASDLYYEHEKEKTLPYKAIMTLEKNENGWKEIAASNDKRDANSYTFFHLKDQLAPGEYRIVISPVKGESMSGGYQLQIGSFGSLKQLKFKSIDQHH